MRKKKIIVKDIYKSFKDKIVLNKLNLDVYESESLSIIGESGSGKSILTRCIVGLLKYDNGSISFGNLNNINTINDKEKMNYMSKFGILFQNSALLDSLNIKENLKFANKQDSFNKILNEVGLPNSILEKYPSELSVGMQKRVGLARAISAEPEILILDEPTTGLDPIMCYQINKLIRKLVVNRKITTITITHDMESVYEFADKVAFINDGIISWYGDTNKIKLSKNKTFNNFVQGNS